MTTEHTRALEAKLAAAEALLAERRAELAAAEAAAREAQAQAWQAERAAKRARRDPTPRQQAGTTYQTLDEALTQFQRAKAEAQAARKAAKPEALPVPRGWPPPEAPPFDLAALDLDQVRAMFQALRDRAQELGMPVADVPAIRMAPEDCNALPVATWPDPDDDDDDDDPRPAKTREQLEQEREELLRELEREAQEEQSAWREAKQDAHYP